MPRRTRGLLSMIHPAQLSQRVTLNRRSTFAPTSLRTATLTNGLPRNVKRQCNSADRVMPMRLSATTSTIAFVGANKAVARIGTQIHFVMSSRDVERLRQFTRTGTKFAHIIRSAPLLHPRNAAPRFKRTNQETKPCALPFTRTFNIQCAP